MKPHVVVDIGNTRIKWGLVHPQRSLIEATESLPDDSVEWQRTIDLWRTFPHYREASGPWQWVAASVNPGRTERLRAWVEGRGDAFFHLRSAAQLPLRIDLEQPEKVGIDRLLNAVAVTRMGPPGRGGVLIDAGSAVTVDWLDERHVYCGGCIFPGLDLMAEALHRYTALLPRVTLSLPVPELPARATVPAMQAGIFLAVTGGIREAVRRYAERAEVAPRVYFSGGQAPVLERAMGLHEAGRREVPWDDYLRWPDQTLVGILHSAESLGEEK
jgi:type III pantothenate kinase